MVIRGAAAGAETEARAEARRWRPIVHHHRYI